MGDGRDATSTASTSGQQARPSGFSFNPSQLKSALKKYGRTGLVTYLGLSTCVTASELMAEGAPRWLWARLHLRANLDLTAIASSFTLTRRPHAGFYIAIESHVDVRSILGLKKGTPEAASLAMLAAGLRV